MNARERSRVETRKRLIEKGSELFSRLGVAQTRATDIAKEAGVAVGTLYLHFENKQGLLRAILKDGAEDLLASFRGLAQNPTTDIAAAVRAHTEIMVCFAEERPSFCHILFDPESVRTNVSAEISDYLVSMQELRLRSEMAQGLLTEDIDPAIAAHAIVGMISGVLDWMTRNPDQTTHAKVVQTLVRLRLGVYQSQETVSRAC